MTARVVASASGNAELPDGRLEVRRELRFLRGVGPHADRLDPRRPASRARFQRCPARGDEPDRHAAIPNQGATEVATRGPAPTCRWLAEHAAAVVARRQRGRELIPKRAAPAAAAKHRRDNDDNDDGNDGSPTDDQSLHRVTSCSQLVIVLQPLQTPAHRCSFPAGRDARSDDRRALGSAACRGPAIHSSQQERSQAQPRRSTRRCPANGASDQAPPPDEAQSACRSRDRLWRTRGAPRWPRREGWRLGVVSSARG
jgi:hypothetical protein